MWSAGPLIVRVKHVDTLEEDPGSWVVYTTKLHAECRNKFFFQIMNFVGFVLEKIRGKRYDIEC